MKNVLQQLTRYLQEMLKLHIDPKPLKKQRGLPVFIKAYYELYTASILGKPCILALARDYNALTPAAIRKHSMLLQEKLGIPCIYVGAAASFYDRKRLIAHCVQFVILNRQIYLPALGIDWVERFRGCQKRPPAPKKMVPSTQAALIYALIHQEETEFIPLKLAAKLHYTPMTMTRALNELESLNLGKTLRVGKERRFRFESGLWEKAQSFMQSPVKKRIWLKGNTSEIQQIKRLGILAGFSALEKLTMLSAPSHLIYAVSKQVWKKLSKSTAFREIPLAEDANIELEIWNYDPKFCAKDDCVDLFSLYLSLREIQDERVEIALEQLMRILT